MESTPPPIPISISLECIYLAIEITDSRPEPPPLFKVWMVVVSGNSARNYANLEVGNPPLS